MRTEQGNSVSLSTIFAFMHTDQKKFAFNDDSLLKLKRKQTALGLVTFIMQNHSQQSLITQSLKTVTH